MASIERRGPGQFRALIRRKGHTTVSATFPTRELAASWAATIEQTMRDGRYGGLHAAQRMTLGEALARYAREVTPGKRSARQELQRIAHLREHPLASRPLAEVRGADLADYRDARLAGLPFDAYRALRAKGAVAGDHLDARPVKPNTVRLELAIIGHVYTVARTEWGMEGLASPLKAIRKPKPGKGRERRLEPGEEARLVRACAPSLRPLVELALETAMRRGELAGLHWDQVDLAAGIAHLDLTKNGDARGVPLSPRAVAILRELKAQPVRWASGWVFGPPDLVAQRVTREFQRARKRAGIVGLTFHDLRHEATSRLFERGLGPAEVRAITGHRTLVMLSRYTHLRADDLVPKLAPAPKPDAENNRDHNRARRAAPELQRFRRRGVAKRLAAVA